MNEQQKKELRRLRRLLDQMYKVAEHASLTGAFDEGAVEIISRYNMILSRLNSLGIDTSYLFLPLPEDASLDRVGIACKLLSSYIDEEEEDEDARGNFGANVVIQGLPDLEQLKDIGRIVRENIAESLGRARHEPPTPPTPSAPPTPPEPLEEAPTQPYRF